MGGGGGLRRAVTCMKRMVLLDGLTLHEALGKVEIGSKVLLTVVVSQLDVEEMKKHVYWEETKIEYIDDRHSSRPHEHDNARTQTEPNACQGPCASLETSPRTSTCTRQHRVSS